MKIKQARTILNLTQKQVSELTGINQKDLSLLESGKRLFIPEELLRLFAERGIDLNSIYSDSPLAEKKEGFLLQEDIIPYQKNTEKKYIIMLERQHEEDLKTIEVQRLVIKNLQQEIELYKGNQTNMAASA